MEVMNIRIAKTGGGDGNEAVVLVLHIVWLNLAFLIGKGGGRFLLVGTSVHTQENSAEKSRLRGST